jgi:hypothetical protein
MSEREEYTPPMGQIRSAYADTAYSDARQDALLAAFDRALDAHDRALREQIARDIEAKADDPDPTLEPQYFAALDIAARIARGEGSE